MNSTQTKLKKCAICQTDTHATHYVDVFDSRLGKPQDILKCEQCGLVYVNEPIGENFSFELSPDDENFEAEWTEQFPDSLDTYADDAWGTQYQDPDNIYEWQFQTTQNLIRQHVDQPDFTLVELGCSRGYLLERLRAAFPEARLIGVEPSPVMAAMVAEKGFEAVNGIMEQSDLAPGTLDVLVAFGSFIQVRDPLSTLQYINSRMRANGVIQLDSPNDDSLFRLLVRGARKNSSIGGALGMNGSIEQAHRLIYNPGRFYYYTKETYGKLLEAAGFQLVDHTMRQPRYVTFERDDLPSYVKVAMRTVSKAEQVTNKQSWVEVVGRKVRDVEYPRT